MLTPSIADAALSSIDLPAGFEVSNVVTTALAARLGQQSTMQWQQSHSFI